MSVLSRLFHRDQRETMQPLYAAIVAQGRQPHWYVEGAVPDTLDGRFDMIAAILCQVLLRLEGDLDLRQQSVWLTEIFVDDMDGQLRQIGIGDLLVGKHIGKMMSALGGRLEAYRAGSVSVEALMPALERNLYRGAPPAPSAVAHVADALIALRGRLDDMPPALVVAGSLAS